MMKTLYYFLVIYCVAVVWCSQEEVDKDKSKTKSSSEDEKTVENIMTMIQDTCTRNSRGKTVKQLQKDSLSILDSIREYKKIVTMKKTMQRDIKWIVEESKGHGGVESFMKAFKHDVKDACKPSPRPRDCAEVRKRRTKSAVYTIFTDKSKGSKGVKAYCDMTTDGGGWTRIQRRIDGSVNFQRNWTEYENGFGKADGEYWLECISLTAKENMLIDITAEKYTHFTKQSDTSITVVYHGNKNIHRLTSSGDYKLRVDMVDSSGNKKYAVYSTFKVGDAASKYKLTVGGYSGNAGNGLSAHSGYKFTTFDNDNDINSGNCAAGTNGGWWYSNCVTSLLNVNPKGKLFWGWPKYVKTAAMMIRKL